jgi:hypothetical protein
MTTVAAYKDGLEDIIAARSAICRVDGEAGRKRVPPAPGQERELIRRYWGGGILPAKRPPRGRCPTGSFSGVG